MARAWRGVWHNGRTAGSGLLAGIERRAACRPVTHPRQQTMSSNVLKDLSGGQAEEGGSGGQLRSSPLKRTLKDPGPPPSHSLLQKSINLLTAKNQKTPEAVKKRRPFTVAIEGNIGSGKSTFLKYFSSLPGVDTLQEPIELWTNLEGHNLLGKHYEDPERWSFLFQSYVQLTRLNMHMQASANPVKLIERSLQNNRYCFLESSHDSGSLKKVEYTILCEYYDLLESKLDIGVDLIVYLRSSPETVHRRVVERSRSGESKVTLDYLTKVHNYYDQWLLYHKPRPPPAPVLVIDADQDLSRMQEEYESKKPFIMGNKVLQA